MQVSVSVGTIMIILAWVFFVLGLLLVLPVDIVKLPMSAVECFMAAVAAKLLA